MDYLAAFKEQKEHYLAYRKVFHNDETDVFDKRKKEVLNKRKLARTKQPLGPTPFTGVSNYAAMLMSAAMNREGQQPQGVCMGVCVHAHVRLRACTCGCGSGFV